MCYFIQRNVVVCIAAKYYAAYVALRSKLQYFSDDCTLKETQLRIKHEFLVFLNASSYGIVCRSFTVCGLDNVSVECGEVTRQKRETLDLTHNVDVMFDLFIKLPKEANIDPMALWDEIDDTFEKMKEYVRQSIDRDRFNLTVRDVSMQIQPNSFQAVKSQAQLRCPPGSLPRAFSLTCGMSITSQHSDNALFRPVCSSVLPS